MISIVCVYNNRQVLESYLLKSLNIQSAEYELILIDNTDNNFKSAPEALNYGGNKANQDYILFVHQDIRFESDKVLEDFETTMRTLDNCGIAGVAGFSEIDFQFKSNITNGIPPKTPGVELEIPITVQTLDECLVIIPRTVFKKYEFDEKLGGWHLYAVDYCLNIKKEGYEAYVLPIHVYHRSYMIFYPKEYYEILKKLFDKYKGKYKMIYTSCGFWNVSYPILWYKFLNTKLGHFIRKIVDGVKACLKHDK